MINNKADIKEIAEHAQAAANKQTAEFDKFKFPN